MKVPTVKPPKKLMVMLSDRLYRKIAKMAKTERRTVSQQLLYLMDIGLDFIEQQMDTYAVADTGDKSNTENSEELSPAIGFRIE